MNQTIKNGTHVSQGKDLWGSKNKTPINFPAEKMGVVFGLALSGFWPWTGTIRQFCRIKIKHLIVGLILHESDNEF